MRRLSRRRLFQLSLGSLLLPRRLLASSAGDRKFLFLFADGGWDPTWGFAPMYDSAGIDSNPEGEPAAVGDLDYVACPTAPAIGEFFAAYGDRTCLVRGFEVRSIAHERCRRLLMTGMGASNADDWPSQIAGNSVGYLLPHVVVSGPSFTSEYTASVVRIGASGQLSRLLDGSALTEAEGAGVPLGESAASVVARYRLARAEAWAKAAGSGRAQAVGDALVQTNEDLAQLREIDDLDLTEGLEDGANSFASMTPALTCLERGYARSAIVAHRGYLDSGWDHHSEIEQQVPSFEVLFGDLNKLMAELDSRSGTNGGSLADETTVVVFSEMGRAPGINGTGGKDHWTFTSAMFIGAGVAGGRVVGAYDDTLLGRRVDLTSGEVTDSGTLLGSEHLGATILALADLDSEVEPISAVLA